MPVDFSFLQNAAPAKPEEPKQPEQKPDTGLANVTVRVDADCFMQCDGEFVDVPLKAGQVTKTELPTGQHLLEFLSTENPNVKVEKMVDFPESGKNYLVMVNELKGCSGSTYASGTASTGSTPESLFGSVEPDAVEQPADASTNAWHAPDTPPMPDMPGDNNK